MRFSSKLNLAHHFQLLDNFFTPNLMGFEAIFLASTPRIKYDLHTTRNPHYTKLGFAQRIT